MFIHAIFCCIKIHPPIFWIKMKYLSLIIGLRVGWVALLWVDSFGAWCSRVASLTCQLVGRLVGLVRDSLSCLSVELMSAGKVMCLLLSIKLIILVYMVANCPQWQERASPNPQVLFLPFLISHLLMSHWWKQIMWPKPDSRGGEIDSTSWLVE